MINALRAEARRLLGRRITVVALLALLAMIGLYQLQVSSQVSPPSATDIAQMQADYDEYLKDWEAHHEEWEAECAESGATAEECVEPRPELSDWGLAPVPFAEAASFAIGFGVYLGGMVLFIAMASFIGAETTSGSLANWLTFVPNRSIVVISKLVVAAVFSVVVGAAVAFGTVGLAAMVTTLHGQPLTGLDAALAMAARGTLVIAILGIAGFGVGMLTGSTGAAIGALVGGMFVSYLMSAFAYASRWAAYLPPWNPSVNLQAILERGTTYVISGGPGSPMDSESDVGYVERTLSLAHGLGYWAVVLVALLVITWAVFRRRDVT